MDTGVLISLVQESLFAILVFGGMLLYTLVRGKQAIINLILGLYFALLVTLEFPYFDALFAQTTDARTEALLQLIVFGIFTVLATLLFTRLMPREFDEKTFQGFGQKLLFALGGTVLVMAYSYHALPITEFVDPGSPIQALFAPEQGFFFWLMAPFVMLFLL